MDENILNALVGQFLQDLGGAFSVPLVQIGERLGIYQALNDPASNMFITVCSRFVSFVMFWNPTPRARGWEGGC